MKLIVHIGTPKTGTTAVQRFLHENYQVLQGVGLHYATPPHNLGHANAVANALNAGDNRAVQNFLTKHVRRAQRSGAETILISAENFYVRDVLASMQRGEACHDAIERDGRLVKTFRDLLPSEIEACQIACYFRRPDRYAESLYNQHVKRGIVQSTFAEFLSLIEPTLLYDRCMRSWADVFGKSNCIVRAYDSVKKDVVGDFVVNVLGIQDLSGFSHIHTQANERVSRDLLEFKRLTNRTARFPERYIDATVFHLIEEEMGLLRGEPVSYQDFLSPDDRAHLLARLQPELHGLQRSYGVPAFAPFDREAAKTGWRPYPGLDPERRRAIELHYERINRRRALRLERTMMRSAAVLRRRVPGTGFVIDAVKRVGTKRALHGYAVGMQRGMG